jgi:probable HAF family extracellular repeat protein
MKYRAWLLLIVGWLSAVQGEAAPAYDVHDLGNVLPQSINAEGVVAGSVVLPAQQAVVILPDGTTTPLGFLPDGNFSLANDISGEMVVGYASTGRLALQTHAFAWTSVLGMRDLGTLGDAELFSAATGVNGSGTIVGYGTRPVPGGGEERRPVVWIAEQIADLDTLGGPEGFAEAMNEQGDIVGESQTANGIFHATLWPVDGAPVDLDTLGSRFSMAVAVNLTRQVIGNVQLPGLGQRGFVWTPGEGMQDLNAFPGDEASAARDINDAGVIVGSSWRADPVQALVTARAVAWMNGTISDLNTLIDNPEWTLESAQAINEAGWIVGTGTFQDHPRAFLLKPILPAEDPPPRHHRHRQHHRRRVQREHAPQ